MPFCRKFASLCAASVLLSVSVQPSIAQQKPALSTRGASAEASFRSWLTTFEKSGAKISQVASSYDETNDTLTIQGLSVRWPQQSGANRDADTLEFKVGDLAVRSFKANGQWITFQSLHVNNATVQSSGSLQPFKIAKFTANGGRLPSLTGFVADPAKPFTTQIRLMRLLTGATVENASAEAIEIGNSFTVASASLDGLSGAKARLIQLKSVQSRSAPDETGRTWNDATVDLLKVSNVNFDPYLRLFESSAYLDRGSARPWVNMIDRAELNGLKVRNGSVVVDVNSALAGPLKLKQFNENLTETFDRAAVDPGFLATNPESARKIAMSVRDAFALDSLSGEGIVVAGQNQSGIVNATVAKAEVANFTATSISRIKANGLNYTDPTGQVTFSGLDFGGINLVAVKSGLEKTSRGGNGDAGEETIVPTIASVGAQGLTFKMQGMSASLNQFDLSMAYFIGATPTSVNAKLGHLRFAADQVAEPSFRQLLKDLGYSDVDLSFSMSGFWDDASSTIMLEDLTVVGADIGTLAISGAFPGVTREGLESPRKTLPLEVSNLAIQNLRVTFENDSLFDRVIGKVAQANDKSVEEIRALLSGNLPILLSSISPTELRNRFLFAGTSFLNNPRILSFGATPTQIVRLQDVAAAIRDPAKLPSLLNIDVSANNRKQ